MSSDPKSSPKVVSRSVAIAQGKTRAQRVQRLKTTLETRLVEPIPAVDALMTELAEGDPQSELWDQLHLAAKRDGVERGLADAYTKCLDGPRMKRLPRDAQVGVLLHAAEYFRGTMNDEAKERSFLERIVDIAPEHADVFTRLEQQLEKSLDALGLLALYAKVAPAAPPRPLDVLANQAVNRLLLLPAKTPLPENACRGLLTLVGTNPRVLDALEKHCCATNRSALACSLIEQALADKNTPEPLQVQWHHRLVELYMGDAESPASAMPHIEELLKRDPSHAKALTAAEKLLATRTVQSRAAAALREARKTRGH